MRIVFMGMRNHHVMEIQNPTLGWRLIWPEVWFLGRTLQKVQSPEKCQMGTVWFQFSRILGISLNLLSPIAGLPTFPIILLKEDKGRDQAAAAAAALYQLSGGGSFSQVV